MSGAAFRSANRHFVGFFKRFGQWAVDVQVAPSVVVLDSDRAELSIHIGHTRIRLVPSTGGGLEERKGMWVYRARIIAVAWRHRPCPRCTAFLIGAQPGSSCEEELRAHGSQAVPAQHVRVVQTGVHIVLVCTAE